MKWLFQVASFGLICGVIYYFVCVLLAYVPDDWEIDRDNVVLERELGEGAFGLVFLGKWCTGSGREAEDVAVKVRDHPYVSIN